MGWMSWGTFDCELRCHLVGFDNCISAALFKSQAQALEEEGYLDAGYNTIHIDDCWPEDQRDKATLKLVPNKTRFPDGIDGLSSHLHAKGIRLGLYTDIGVLTCGGYPGSRGYYDLDAATFASWGVDYLKVDGCYERNQNAYEGDYAALGSALRATGRPIQYNCGWPAYLGDNETAKPYPEIVQAGCTTWRNWRDIEDSWDRLLAIVDHWGTYGQFLSHAAAQAEGRFNDPDMLVIGMSSSSSSSGKKKKKNGMGMGGEINQEGASLTLDEQRLQLAVWCVVSAPLIMGNDLRRVGRESKALLLNQEMIAIDQDPLGLAGWRVSPPPGPVPSSAKREVWARPLQGGQVAVALLNKLGEKEDKVEFNLDDVLRKMNEVDRYDLYDLYGDDDVSSSPRLRGERCAMVRDVFAKKDLGKKCGTAAVSVGPHGAALLRISPTTALADNGIHSFIHS